jgi:hypothetical protein
MHITSIHHRQGLHDLIAQTVASRNRLSALARQGHGSWYFIG